MKKENAVYLVITALMLVLTSAIIFFFRIESNAFMQEIFVYDHQANPKKMGGFCVPDEQSVDDQDQSLRFKGYLGAGEHCKNCLFPELVTGGEIVKKIRPQVMSFADIQSNPTLENLIFHSPKSQISNLYNGKFILTKNSSISPKWYVWKSSSSSSVNPQLDENTLLIAECDSDLNEQINSMSLSCSRYVMGDNYGVNYSFRMREVFDVGQIDYAVKKTIDGWKCKNNM
jgi:hypothetical protein